MKHLKIAVFTAISLFSLAFSACLKDSCTQEQVYTQWNPVYKSDAQIRVTPRYEAVRAMKNTGKIYFYDHYVLVNERKEGIHVIDNTNPSNPVNIGFINIQGNVDMAVKGNFLYADNYMDLITLDIRNITNPTFVCRTENVFQTTFFKDPTLGWLVDYEPIKVNIKIDCTDPKYVDYGNGWLKSGGDIFSTGSQSGGNTGVFTTSGSTGGAPASAGGSMARFTFYTNYLYAIDRGSLITFNLAAANCPNQVNTQQVGWNIETVFPYKNSLFIGSTTGVSIFDLTNPALPRSIGRFNHGTSCDPVVVENDIAYSTLHSGTTCNGSLNQLDILDVKNLSAPVLLKSYNMTSPKGLSIWDNMLYLCDDGLKIYDVTNKLTIDQNLKSHIKGFDTYDVIPYEVGNRRNLMVIGADGLYQFDVTDAANPKQLSKIGVVK